MGGEVVILRWIKSHELLAFFLVIFLLVLGGWYLSTHIQIGTLANLGSWTPALSAILITAVTRGKMGLKDLYRRLVLWRAPGRWYLVIFLGWPAITILASLVYAQMTSQPLVVHWNQWSGLLAWLSWTPVLGFWACEEIGWRGFALPRLLERWNALLSSAILGILWAIWHLPIFLGGNGIRTEFYLFPVFTITLSILMTWVWKHTGGSIFVATGFHFWVNGYGVLQDEKLPLARSGGAVLIQYLLLAAAAALVVIFYGYRDLHKPPSAALPEQGEA